MTTRGALPLTIDSRRPGDRSTDTASGCHDVLRRTYSSVILDAAGGSRIANAYAFCMLGLLLAAPIMICAKLEGV